MYMKIGQWVSKATRPIVAFHVSVHVTHGCLYLMYIFADVSPSTEYLLWSIIGYLTGLIALSYVLTAVTIYLNRNVIARHRRRPSRWYYLMAVPLYFNAILYGIEYLIVSGREE